jgi:8-oxo-dGTP pyrophosphatase MutT (NUDIX family)
MAETPLQTSFGIALRVGRQVFRLIAFCTRPFSIGVHAVVIRKDGAILLARHTYKSGWYFPGGAVKRGENAVEAMQRELREETGLDLDISAEQIFGAYYCRHDFRHNHVILFLIRLQDTCSVSEDKIEIAELKFFLPEKFPPETTSSVSRRLEEIAAGMQSTAQW